MQHQYLSCGILVSETATPWHGVSISNCTQQETPGVLSRNWLAIRLVAKHTAMLQFRYFISEFPDKLYWTYGISWASRHMCIACCEQYMNRNWHPELQAPKLASWTSGLLSLQLCSYRKKRSKSSAWTETSRSPFSKKTRWDGATELHQMVMRECFSPLVHKCQIQFSIPTRPNDNHLQKRRCLRTLTLNWVYFRVVGAGYQRPLDHWQDAQRPDSLTANDWGLRGEMFPQKSSDPL